MIQPTVQTLRDLFGDRVQYAVPVYQRPYVWTEEDHWKPLWEDIRELADRFTRNNRNTPAHFLGAIVIELRSAAPGRVREFTVIDGQQRLTTLQLLLAAFYRVLASLNVEAKTEIARLLENTGTHVDGDLCFKVWPGRYDQPSLRWALSHSSLDPDSSSPLLQATRFFEERIRDWIASDEDTTSTNNRLDALNDTLDGLIQLVSIQLDGTSDAQVVFETLNSRGADLTSLDLAKNALLYQADRDGLPVISLHDEHWEPALGDAGYWLEPVRHGRYLRERADIFLMHWLTMKLGEIPRGQHLFADFRNKILRCDPPPQVSELLPEICGDARVLRSFDDLDVSQPEGMFFRRLGQMDTKTVIPVVLLLFRTRELLSTRRRRAIAAIESWLVRRMILGATTQHYNRLLTRLLARMRAESSLATADDLILATLRDFDNPTDRWPADAEVRDRLLFQPLYGFINQRRIAMLLEACEYVIAEEGSELIRVPDGLTLEHALPQKWHQNWPVPDDAEDLELAEQEREARVHRLGNLTLVTQKLNSSLSNAPWKTKRHELARRSQLLVNQRLCSNEHWDEEAIDARSLELVNCILATWPGPESRAWDS